MNIKTLILQIPYLDIFKIICWTPNGSKSHNHCLILRLHQCYGIPDNQEATVRTEVLREPPSLQYIGKSVDEGGCKVWKAGQQSPGTNLRVRLPAGLVGNFPIK